MLDTLTAACWLRAQFDPGLAGACWPLVELTVDLSRVSKVGSDSVQGGEYTAIVVGVKQDEDESV